MTVGPDSRVDYCPVCGGTVTIVGRNTVGWLALCMWGHSVTLTDSDLTYGRPGRPRSEPGQDGTGGG